MMIHTEKLFLRRFGGLRKLKDEVAEDWGHHGQRVAGSPGDGKLSDYRESIDSVG